MTVIAAAFNNERDYAIASDSVSELDGARVPSGAKVWRWGSVLLGSHGLASQRQRAIRWTSARPAPVDAEALVLALVELHQHLAANVGPPPFAEVALMGLGVLVASPWGVMELDSGGAVTAPPRWAWWASGSGGATARGAMAFWSTEGAIAKELQAMRTGWPAWLVTAAVRAAIALDTGCGGAPVVLTGEAP